MAFGKKNKVDLNWYNYNSAILGEPGVGKTTIVYQMCEKELGDDGYLFVECGKEDGADSIEGINYINCPAWKAEYDDVRNSVGFADLVEDILENKNTDYPNLKIVVIDTYDQLRKIVEPEVIRLANKNSEKKIVSIKQAFGGYMAGDDKCDEMLLDILWRLKEVGVHFFLIGHTKRKDVTGDSGETYTKITSDMTERSFNQVKNKLHFLGMATIDREYKKKEIKGKSKNFVTAENRKITFRDDDYALDSKSRFAEIINEIPFSPDEFINAMNNAIQAEAKKSGKSITDLEKEQKIKDKAVNERAKKTSDEIKNNKVDLDRNEELITIMKEQFKSMEAGDKKDVIKSRMKEMEMKNFDGLLEKPTKEVEDIYQLFV
jgi:GTPase SAR1 family protein